MEKCTLCCKEAKKLFEVSNPCGMDELKVCERCKDELIAAYDKKEDELYMIGVRGEIEQRKKKQ